MPARPVSKNLKSRSTRNAATRTSGPQGLVTFVGTAMSWVSAWRQIQAFVDTSLSRTRPVKISIHPWFEIGSESSARFNMSITCLPTRNMTSDGYERLGWKLKDESTTSVLLTPSSTKNGVTVTRFKRWLTAGSALAKMSHSSAKPPGIGGSMPNLNCGSFRPLSSDPTGKQIRSKHSPSGKNKNRS